MKPILAGVLALVSALVFNRLLVKYKGPGAIFFGVPVIEELSKLGAALVLDAPFVLTYLVFGIGEAFYDLKSKKSISLLAALFSIISHYLFGVGAELVWGFTASIFPVIALTIVSHAVWNKIVLLFGRKLETK